MSRPRALAALIQPLVRAGLGKGGAALGALLADWPAIAGEAIAARTRPERLTFAAGARQGAVLTLRVDPADALELQHEEPRLLERLNAHYGYRAIERLRLIQAPLDRRPPKPPPRPLTGAESASIDAALAPVAEPDLRDRLAAFARALYRRDPAS